MTHYMTRRATTDAAQWLKFIHGGSNSDIDAVNSIGADQNDIILVDISQALSQRLGRQMSMMSNYRVNYLRIDLVNSKEGTNNQSAVNFGGAIHWHSQTAHKTEAMKLARQVERMSESTDIDSDSFLLSDDNDYTGMRFNWNNDEQIIYATHETFTGLTGDEWDLEELFSVYNDMHIATDKTNRLWTNGRCGYTEQMAWAASYANQTDTDSEALGFVDETFNPTQNAFVWQCAVGQEIDVLSGLMEIRVEHCSTDEPFAQVDDDYHVQVTIGVSGWSDF